MRVTHGRGLISETLRRNCIHRKGPKGWDEVLDKLSPEGRRIFAEPLGDFTWVPIELLNELEDTAHSAMEDSRPFEQGTSLAEQQLKVVHPWLLKLLSPETLIRQAPTIYRYYYKGGIGEVAGLSRGHGVFNLWATGLSEGWFESGLAGWFSTALRLSGVHKVDVQHEGPPVEGDPYRHRYTVLWE